MAPPFVKYWKGWNRPISVRWLGSHQTVMGFVLGLRFGVGALAGDSIKSAVKRRLGIASGRPQVRLSTADLAFLLGLSLLGHFAVSRIGFWVGVRDVKF